MIMTNFIGIPADKFQKNVRIVFMRVILGYSVIVDVWLKIELNQILKSNLKRSFYTTDFDEHIATFFIRSKAFWCD